MKKTIKKMYVLYDIKVQLSLSNDYKAVVALMCNEVSPVCMTRQRYEGGRQLLLVVDVLIAFSVNGQDKVIEVQILSHLCENGLYGSHQL